MQLCVLSGLWILFILLILINYYRDDIITVTKVVMTIPHFVSLQIIFNPIFTISGNISIKLSFYKTFYIKGRKISSTEI